MPRITRIAGSFAIVVIVYWAYALLAVPWIEPAADPHLAEKISKAEREKSAELVDMRLEQLKGLFPDGAWELQNPKILESDRAKLLFREYHNHPDGRVELRPCTIVFSYDGPAESEEQRQRQSVILESPAGAVLQFDQPLDLNRAKIGRLMRGQLLKEVRIRSDCKQPGPEDDLLIVAQDVQVTEQTVTTPNPVDFRWGRHFGRGQDMVIKLLQGKPKPGMENTGMNVAGIESFEMRKVERLHLDLGQADGGKTAGQTPASVPVEINCRGAFCFNVVGHVATFRDNVDVKKGNPNGPADQLSCNVLSMHFANREKENEAASSATPPSMDLIAERIEAQGNPVVLTAPSMNVVARAEQLEYNLLTSAISIRDSRQFFLQQGPNEIHAKSLYYRATQTGQLGQLESQGPGWLHGQSPERPDQPLEATWNDVLRIDRDQKDPRISLLGGAQLRFPGIAQLQSKEIFFWLHETPSAARPQQFEQHPSRMAARGAVHMNSEQLACQVEDMQIWFEETAQGGRAQAEGGGMPSGPASQQQAGARPNPTIPGIGRMQIGGRSLTAKIVLAPSRQIVSNVTIKDGVRFEEIQTSQPGERPLLMMGDLLVADNLSEPNATVAVTGRQTRFEGRGLGLRGTNINLDCGANRLWINGPGQMDMPLSNVQRTGAPTAPGMLTVDWQRGMSFDGQTAQFSDSVVASARPLQSDDKTMSVEIHTGALDVQLQRPIRFSGQQASGPAEVQSVRCRGGVNIENRAFDAMQQLTSHDRMQTTDLGVNLMSGEMVGGPGWINSVYRGTPELPGTMPSNAARPSNQINGLHVRFQRSLKGNILSQQLTFDDQVQLANAPVDNWDAVLPIDNVDKLGPQGVAASCDLLAINRPLLPLGNQRSLELVAQGNVEIENATYMARGQRIAYNQDKSLLILQGDGRVDAELFQQNQPGAPANKTAAQQIYYWVKTGQVKVVGAQSIQIGQPPSENRLK